MADRNDKMTYSYDEAPPTEREKEAEIVEMEQERKEEEFETLDGDELTRLRDLNSKVWKYYKRAKESRRKFDWEWMVRELYVRGYHFARYNRGTNTITFATRTGVRIPINLTWAHLRAVRNQVTSFRPKWEVMPNVTTESAIENARYSGKILDYVHKKSQVKRKLKEVLTDALLKSIGIWEITMDDNKNIVINATDPFDLYIDPNCITSDINDPEWGAMYVVKTFSKPIDEIKNDPKYKNTWQITTGDNEDATAEYKRFMLQVVRWKTASRQQDDDSKMLYEAWFREYQDDGTYKLRVVTTAEGCEFPIRNELTDEKNYPWEVMQGDISPNSLYGESWAKHVIPINRVMDALESHIFEYNHFYARGRYVIDKNSGVRIIVNQHGQIIEKNRGSTVTSLPINPLPSAPQMQIQNFRTYLEDISGAHDVSLGRLPTGIRSGTGIAELRQADATNQDDLVDNLEDFMTRTGSRILELISRNWTTSKLITTTGLGGQPEYFMAIGDRASKMRKKKEYTFGSMRLPLAVIGSDFEVNVQVGSWLAYTKEARQEKLKELYRLGAIDQETLLMHLEFGDIEGIMQRTRTERLLDMRANRPSASLERMGVPEEMTDEELALAENELMMEGKEQPVEPDDDHEVHLSVHREHINDPEFGELIRAHMNEHVSLQKWISQAPQIPPQGMEGESGAAPGGAAPAPGGAPMDEQQMIADMLAGGNQMPAENAPGNVLPPVIRLPRGIPDVGGGTPPLPM
jgi:hypothetical protein